VSLDSRGLPEGYPFRPEFEVAPRDVRELLTQDRICLIDCRSPQEAATAHIEGAVLIPIEDLATQVDDLVDLASGREIVVHCHMGGRSLKAALFLKSRGVEARSMAGGIDLWSVDIDAKVPRYS
jgi:rhodanese-related sulfurtransferase